MVVVLSFAGLLYLPSGDILRQLLYIVNGSCCNYFERWNMVERFAARLRELREEAGLSRKELAERAGMKSEAGIRDLEQGRRSPSWETVLALAAALGVDCTAFTQEPSSEAAEPRKPGRPRKQEEEEATVAKPARNASRPQPAELAEEASREQAGGSDSGVARKRRKKP